GSQVTVAISIDSIEKSKEVFEKLKEDGQVGMPLQETFWSPSYGQVTDKFGVTWQISTQLADNK
ncbi:VOC family protein, partial [Priestia megaterium]|nr:VOC family protein [Priestia megaterium]